QRMDRRSRPDFSLLEQGRFWISDYGAAAAVVAGLFLLFAGVVALAVRSTRGPETFEQARVVRFGLAEGRTWQQPLVIVRTGGGAVRELGASRQALSHCRRGDSITLVHRGSGLFVDRRGCTGGAESAGKTGPI
ncbi:MAG: hypothetical protein ABIW83_08240, partial [Allosphingosinicella sp.]